MSKHGSYVPQNDAGFNTFFKNITQYVAQKAGGSKPEWKHIPKEDQDELNAAYADWYTAYSRTLKPHPQQETKEKNRVKNGAEKLLREFVNRFLRYRPVTDEDRDHMGVPNRAAVRSPQNVPAEQVEFSFKIRGIRQVHVHFKEQGAANKAKPKGYDGAVLVWDLAETPPKRPGDLSRHALASRTPYTLSFDETERGKTMYAALCWQNAKGETGPWSEMQSTIVP